MPDAAGAPRPDDEQLRARRDHGTEEIAQRFAVDEHGPRVPSDAFELGRRAIEILRRRSRSNRVLASDFTRNGRRARDASPRGRRGNSTALTSVTRPSLGADQPADKCQGALGGLRSVDTDDDCAYALRPPDDEYRALGATDDASGDATESYRDCRRAHSLRGWTHGTTKQVFP